MTSALVCTALALAVPIIEGGDVASHGNREMGLTEYFGASAEIRRQTATSSGVRPESPLHRIPGVVRACLFVISERAAFREPVR